MKKQKGITLIALIITIIVMLILVGVTVNVAMQGGLFSTANKASSETTRQAEKDQLISAVLGGLQTGGTFDITKVSLPAGAKWIKSKTDDTNTSPTLGSGNWVMTFSRNKFYVDKYGNVLDDEVIGSDKAETILFKSNTNLGKVTLNKKISKIDNISDYTFKDKFRAYNGDKFMEMNIQELEDTYYILFSIYDTKTDNFDLIYLYTFGAIDTNIDGTVVKVTGEGWHKIENNEANAEIVNDMPVFEGYSTTDWDTDEMIPKSSDVPSNVAGSVEEYINKLFANILIKYDK